jgi:hypothetical protein
LLNIVAEQYCLQWRKFGEFVFLRHREWYAVEVEEVPERTLETWRTSKIPAGMVDPKDFIDAVASLTGDQERSLSVQFTGAILSPPYLVAPVLGTLSQEQRKELLDGRELRGPDLPPSVLERVSTMTSGWFGLRATTFRDIRIRLHSDGNVMSGEVSVLGRVLRENLRVPRRQPLLPPVNVKMERAQH